MRPSNVYILVRLKVAMYEVHMGESGRWTLTEDRLVGEAGPHAWTGHSECCTLPGALANLGVPREQLDPLGRWAPSGSDDYAQTYKAVAKQVAGRLIEGTSTTDPCITLGEEDVACETADRLLAKGVD